MLVNLIYFQSSGKFYSSWDYETRKHALFEIWEEVEQMRNAKSLPGLMKGHGQYIVYVDAPSHPHRHPHLIL